jgi:hypothetical protein
MSDPTDVFLTDADIEARWRRKPGYCAEQRAQGRGPKFVRLSPRVLVHRLSDVIEFEARNTFASPAEAMVASDGDFPPEAA